MESTANEIMKENPVAEEPKKPAKRKSGFSIWKPKTWYGLLIRIVLGIGLPYGYLLLCGYIFDRKLHMYNMTPFIFFSYLALQILGVVFAIVSIANYCRQNRKKRGAASDK